MSASFANKPLTHKRVWLLAGPIMLSNISVPLVGAVDTAVVGHLPEPTSIGAVALGALIFGFVFWGFGFLRMGTTGFIARAYGANDVQDLSDTLLRVMLLALTFGLLLILMGSPIIRVSMWLLDSSIEIESLTSDYALIRIWSAPATLCIYVLTGVFIGMHNTMRAFILQLVLNLTNVLLDLWFVLGLELGVEGVALATLMSEYLAAGLGLFLLRNNLKIAVRMYSWTRLIDRSALVALMQANGDIFIRTLCLMFSLAYFTAESARMGEVVLAANAILMHLLNIMAYGLDGFAHAAEALTGSAYGASQKESFKRAVRLTTIWAFIIALMVSLAYFLFGSSIISLFTGIDDVLGMAQIYLPWMVVSPLLSIWSFQLDGIFIGSGYTREMRNAMIVSMLVYLAALSLLIPWLGNHGLFLGLSLFMVVRAISLGWYYPRILASMSLVRQ